MEVIVGVGRNAESNQRNPGFRRVATLATAVQCSRCSRRRQFSFGWQVFVAAVRCASIRKFKISQYVLYLIRASNSSLILSYRFSYFWYDFLVSALILLLRTLVASLLVCPFERSFRHQSASIVDKTATDQGSKGTQTIKRLQSLLVIARSREHY